jgi:uncharacterized protein
MLMHKMVAIRVLKDNYSVFKFPASEDLLCLVQILTSQATVSSPLFSLTRTPEETSLVCKSSCLDTHAFSSVCCEHKWRALQVVGPLDFGLTGILSSIALPLAEAGVSIFAVSTYNTDYVLVKQDKLSEAVAALQAAGHTIEQDDNATSSSVAAAAAATATDSRQQQLEQIHLRQKLQQTAATVVATSGTTQAAATTATTQAAATTATTQAGSSSHAGNSTSNGGGSFVQAATTANAPASGSFQTFVADPYVSELITKRNKTRKLFSLVLVTKLAGLGPEKYEGFCNEVKECFCPSDLDKPNQAVYFYPLSVLHVTVATFIPLCQELILKNRRGLTELAQKIFHQARHDTRWPTSGRTQLRIESAQIGERAGIILWKDGSGIIDKMRECIRDASIGQIAIARSRIARLRGATSGVDSSSVDLDTEQYAVDKMDPVQIPNIIHSTFMRFNRVPDTPVNVVQEKLQQFVIPELSTFLPYTQTEQAISLVVEDTPYMHMKAEDREKYTVMQFPCPYR